MLAKLPYIGRNAFKDGFLSDAFTKPFVDRANLWNDIRVILPSSAWGSAKFVTTERNAILDLSLLRVPSKNTEPFGVQAQVAVNGTIYVKVNLGSGLLRSVMQTDKIAITGLNQWLPITANQMLYLEINSTTFEANIKVGQWATYPEPIGWVNPAAVDKVQSYAYLVIGVLKSNPAAFPITTDDSSFDVVSGDNRYSWYQKVTTHLMLAQTCYSGAANVLYPIPWHGAILT